jgi:hypothetical protein
VMGWNVDRNPDGSVADLFWMICPRYSADIAAAWKVVEKMKWFCLQRSHGYWVCEYDDGKYIKTVDADTAPLAICRASLLAVTP